MNVTESERESAIRRYRSILDALNLDVELAEGCAKCEMSGGNPSVALQRMVEYRESLKDNTVMPQTKRDSEVEDIRKEVESIMLYGGLTAEAEYQNCKRR